MSVGAGHRALVERFAIIAHPRREPHPGHPTLASKEEPWCHACSPNISWADIADALDIMGDLLAALERTERERDEAIAHDRQPYPTAWAYEQAVVALEKHRQRANKAEARLETVDRERDQAHQTMWDMYREMGFDTDGNPGPGAVIAGGSAESYRRMMLDAAKEFRRDYDAALDEIPSRHLFRRCCKSILEDPHLRGCLGLPEDRLG